SGREGIGTTDVRAILEQEILPLHPDYVVFYDGANQLVSFDGLLPSQIQVQRSGHTRWKPATLFSVWWLEHSRLAALVNGFFQQTMERMEHQRPKPTYALAFPKDFNEDHPNVADSGLPLGLPVFIRDVRTMISDARAAGVPFTMSTLPWLDGSEVKQPGDARFAHIIEQLDSTFWPLQSADIRRLITLQNRALRRLAETQGVPLLDEAASYPLDPRLFTDMYHLNQEGVRLQAWIMLRNFIPVLQRDLAQGLLSRIQARVGAPVHPVGLQSLVVHPQCAPNAELMSRARVIPTQAIMLVNPAAVQTNSGETQTIRTSAQPWSYAGRLNLYENCVTGAGWVVIKARVSKGTVSIGVLNRREDGFVTRQSVTQSYRSDVINLKIPSFAASGALIVQNGDQAVASEIEIDEVRVVANDGTAPICPIIGDIAASEQSEPVPPADFTAARIVPGAADLHEFVSGSPGGGTTFSSAAVTIVPPAQQWALGGSLPLKVPESLVNQGWVRVIADVQQGNVGFGLLDETMKKYVTRVFIGPIGGRVTIMLPLPKRHVPLSLIVENAAPTPATSKAVVQSVDVIVPAE
ncbi:MAG TPA: SGNH/GDSL hydrolase family protein, partial [Acetobacteraceae bacterium]|nr:SGNH/GDSL hydrolase family protein [Acetobacteraceae bacterium]